MSDGSEAGRIQETFREREKIGVHPDSITQGRGCPQPQLVPVFKLLRLRTVSLRHNVSALPPVSRRKVTGYPSSGRDFAQWRNLGSTACFRNGAARVKWTAGGRMDRRRNITRQHDSLSF